ncbi:unnamed protein product [Blepharisma stoltei]|uniref:Peptidase C1A papain C-terminal domain-containing protein n=1 Tax=Blepharisma stoltei TaxID=1481888 RepID=A0AAU9JUM0_9CILI|nr:unnamed protein product [Blepharisma stoltei]
MAFFYLLYTFFACNYFLKKSIVAFNKFSAFLTFQRTAVKSYAAFFHDPLVEANQFSWQLYKGGIVSKDCGTALDHGVLIVGYNFSNSPQYWKVKNSWGPTWGEQGYLRIAVKAGAGICGIQMQPSYPTV